MAEDLTSGGLLAASHVAELNHKYLVAKVRFNELLEGMSSVSKGIPVCYIQDSEHILGKVEDLVLPGALYVFVRHAVTLRAYCPIINSCYI